MRKALVVVAVLISPLAHAQETVVAPMLTEVQKLNVQLRLKELENAQLRLQIAQEDFNRARLEAQDVLNDLKRPGWRLDIQKLEYLPEPKKEAK